jgi:hypothetical protein
MTSTIVFIIPIVQRLKPGSVCFFRSQKGEKDSSFWVLDIQHPTRQTDILTTAFSPPFLSEDEISLSFWNTPRPRKINKILIEPEALALQIRYAAYVGSLLQTFWENLSVRSCGDNQSKKNNWLNGTGRFFRNVDNRHLRRVTCQKVERLSYTVAQAWNPALLKFIVAYDCRNF